MKQAAKSWKKSSHSPKRKRRSRSPHRKSYSHRRRRRSSRGRKITTTQRRLAESIIDSRTTRRTQADKRGSGNLFRRFLQEIDEWYQR